MNTDNFKSLRVKSGLTQAEVASLFGVSARTIAGWESASPKNFTNLETMTITQLFQPILLERKLREMAEKAFNAIPSELIAIWIVDREECYTLPKTTRQAFTLDNNISKTICSLLEESLTTYPLRTGETLNLSGDEILNHKAKKNKSNRASYLFRDGLCESLLHVPGFLPSSRGPQPVILLSLENKFHNDAPDYTVIKAGPEGRNIYSGDDVATAEALVREFKELLYEDMQLLGMVV